MTENFNYLFHYTEHESIKFDKSEFLFQIQSHPDYPSLLSVSDTLSFFNIKNGAVRVDISKIETLPDHFVAFLKEENDESQLFYFIKRREGKYFISKNKKIEEIAYSSLESRWLDLIFLIEKPKFENSIAKNKKNKIFWLLPVLCSVLFFLTLFQFTSSISIISFFLFPVIGFLFSVAALKDLFGTKSKWINKFCNITTSASCTSIVNSGKWKILKILNFSDLSIVFFVSQFLGLMTSLFTGDTVVFFFIQKILLFSTLPIVLLSLYYQKFVEKRWCPICLGIIFLLVLEILYIALFINNAFSTSFKPIAIFGLVLLCTILIWGLSKKILSEQQYLKGFQLKANRFLRNYEIFKNSLLSTEKVELPFSPIVLGNPESKTQIIIITNPFCGHCRETHEILDEILEKYGQNLQMKIVFKTNFKMDSEKAKEFFRALMTIYLEKGEQFFKETLNYFFKCDRNIEKWIQLYSIPVNIKKVDPIYNGQNNWCIENGINYTPVIFVNGYIYPHTYERTNLKFFISNLIEDINF